MVLHLSVQILLILTGDLYLLMMWRKPPKKSYPAVSCVWRIGGCVLSDSHRWIGLMKKARCQRKYPYKFYS